jgi:hypothetical protein
VRWTEKRNFETILDLLSSGLINTEILITHKFLLSEIDKAYQELDNENALGIIIQYEENRIDIKKSSKVRIDHEEPTLKDFHKLKPNVSFLGSGNYATRFLIPNFKKSGVNFNTIVTSEGFSGVKVGRNLGLNILQQMLRML